MVDEYEEEDYEESDSEPEQKQGFLNRILASPTNREIAGNIGPERQKQDTEESVDDYVGMTAGDEEFLFGTDDPAIDVDEDDDYGVGMSEKAKDFLFGLPDMDKLTGTTSAKKSTVKYRVSQRQPDSSGNGRQHPGLGGMRQ